MEVRKNPHIYEINLMTWLEELTLKEGHVINLGNIPSEEWRYLKSLGMDIVWLMGIWQRSPYSTERARKESYLIEECKEIIPDFSIDDITGSPYAVYDYIPDPKFGTKEDLISLKKILEEGGLSGPITAVPTGIDIKPFREADGSAVRQERGWGDDTVLISIGRLGEERRFAQSHC